MRVRFTTKLKSRKTRILAALGLAVLLAPALLVLGKNVYAETQDYTYSGQLRTSQNDVLNGVVVELTGVYSSDYARVVTDQNGQFSATLPQGDYRLTVSYTSGQTPLISELPTEYRLTAGSNVTLDHDISDGITLAVTRLHVKAVDTAGVPVPGARITADARNDASQYYGDPPAQRPDWNGDYQNASTTDSSGEAVIKVLQYSQFNCLGGSYIRAAFSNGTAGKCGDMKPYITGESTVTIVQGTPNTPSMPTFQQSYLGRQPSISWNAVHGSFSVDHYNVYRDGQYITSTSDTAFTDTTAPEGAHNYTISSVGPTALAESEMSAPRFMLADRTSPVISDAQLDKTLVQPNENIKFTATVVDPGAYYPDNVITDGNYEWRIDNGPTSNSYVQSTVPSGSSAPAHMTVNIATPTAPGIHTLYFRVSDAVRDFSDQFNVVPANWSDTVAVPFSVRLPAPTDLRVDQQPYANSTATLHWTSVSGADHYNVYRDDVKVGSSAINSFTDQTTGVNGRHKYDVRAALSNDAESTPSDPLWVEFDTTPPVKPTLTWSLNPLPAGQTTTLSAHTDDTNSGVQKAEYFVGADPGVGNATAMNGNSNNWSANFGNTLAVGTYTVGVRSRDQAGNWSATANDVLVIYAPNNGTVSGHTTSFPTATDTMPIARNGGLLPTPLQVGFTNIKTGADNTVSGSFNVQYIVWGNYNQFTLTSSSLDHLSVSSNGKAATLQGKATLTKYVNGVKTVTNNVTVRFDIQLGSNNRSGQVAVKIYQPGVNPDGGQPSWVIDDSMVSQTSRVVITP
jgi:hypothetical protein